MPPRCGDRVALLAAEAHVNAVPLPRMLSEEAPDAAAEPGPPEEIGGFAALSNAAADEPVATWLAAGQPDATQREPQTTGTAGFDPTRTVWSVDADEDGAADAVVRLEQYPTGWNHPVGSLALEN